jgi:uncharacterized damage-inducible protein DinB
MRLPALWRTGADKLNADYCRTLFDYNYWARDRILAILADVSEGEFARDNGFTYRSIRGILAHCLDAEYGWRHRFEGKSRNDILTGELLATPRLLADRWRLEEVLMRSYLSLLTDSQLTGDLTWVDAQGINRRLPNLWASLTHVIVHTAQHRSEAAEALTMIGRSPGDLDFGVYAAEKLS